jgi:pyrroloquinoline-quinone synthase
VAALYAFEAQVPEIATTKIDGLRRHYGVSTAQGLAYFRVHEEADRMHRAAWRGWLENESNKGGANGERVLLTARKALDALWGGLDSIQAAPC